MTVRIGSNISSLQTQRRLSDATSTLSKVYERLSSGQRINNASDDAAGLAIATQLNSDTRVFSQAIRNVNDGLSVLSISDQALQQLSSITTRQQELAEQSANGTLSIAQRRSLDNEATQLTNEYNRILSTTKFNGQTIYGASGTEITIQAGSGEQATLSISMGAQLSGAAGASSNELSVSSSGTAESSSISFNESNYASLTISFAEGTSFTNEVSLLNFTDGAYYSGGETFEIATDPNSGYISYYLKVDGNGSGPGTAIDISSSDSALMVANAVAYAIGGSANSNVVTYTAAVSMTEGNTLNVTSSSGNIGVTTQTEGNVNFNYTGGEYFKFSDISNGNNTIYAWLSVGGTLGYDPSLGGTGMKVDIDQYDSGSAVAGKVAAAITASLSAAGYSVAVNNSQLTITNLNLVAGSLGLSTSDSNKIGIVSSNGGSGLSNGDYFRFFTPDGANSYYVYFGSNDPNLVGYSQIHVTNYVYSDAQNIASAIASAITSSGAPVTASAVSGNLTITNNSAGNVTDLNITGSYFISGSLSVLTQGAAPSIDATTDRITYNSHGLSTGQRIRLSSSGGAPGGLSTGVDYYAIIVDANTFKLATSSANAQAGTAINLTSVGTGSQTFTAYSSATASTLTANQIDLTSAASSRTALTTLAARQQQLGLEIGAQGAFQSRLISSLNNLQASRENYSGAYSRIISADIALDSANLVKTQILQQAASSVLAQANQLPALALKLLT